MKSSIRNIAMFCVAWSAVTVVGCGESGPSASTDQMAAQRDSQLKAMASQRGGVADRGATSAAAAASKGGTTPASTGQ